MNKDKTDTQEKDQRNSEQKPADQGLSTHRKDFIDDEFEEEEEEY